MKTNALNLGARGSAASLRWPRRVMPLAVVLIAPLVASCWTNESNQGSTVASGCGDAQEGVAGEGIEVAYPCPSALEACYAGFGLGQECQPGKLIVRAEMYSAGGSEVCADTDVTELAFSSCLFYYDPIATVSYCCNGYIANRSTAIVDARNPECCPAGLQLEYGGSYNPAPAVDDAGVHDPGLDVSRHWPDLNSEDVVCIVWAFSNGMNTTGYIYRDGGAYGKYYPATVEQVGGKRIVHCRYDAEPIATVQADSLELWDGVSWLSPCDGKVCIDVQDTAYN